MLGNLAREFVRLGRLLAAGNPLDLPNVERRHGSWNHADIEWLAPKVTNVAGAFAEIGMFRGAAFRKVAELAAAQKKLAHAFDSFAGMDEPTAALGVKESRRVLELILDVKRRGLPIVLISHNMPQVFEVADRIQVLRRGQRVATYEASKTSIAVCERNEVENTVRQMTSAVK